MAELKLNLPKLDSLACFLKIGSQNSKKRVKEDLYGKEGRKMKISSVLIYHFPQPAAFKSYISKTQNDQNTLKPIKASKPFQG